MPRTLDELAEMIARRDNLAEDLGVEPDYLDLFIL